MNKELCIAICTADQQTAALVSRLLQSWAQEICVSVEIKKQGLIFEPQTADFYAMLLVDSNGLGMDELANLQRLREKNPACGVVLLAGDDRAAIGVYQCHPNALVPKPVTYSGLSAAMERCFPCWQRGLSWLDLPLQHKRVRIPLYQLYYAEAAGRNTILHRAGGVLQVNCSLSSLEEQLPYPPFLRCQKSFLVHLGAIKRLTGGELIMCNNRVVPVARGKTQRVQAEISAYWKQRGREEDI